MPDSIIKAPVVMPANFVGVCTKSLVAAPGAVKHGLVRSWDYQGSRGLTTTRAVVCRINPSAGTWDWQTFDELLSNNTDKQIIITLGQPGDYLVTPAAIGGAYNGGKANMCPTDLSTWATVVQAVVSRANTNFGRTGLIWELWNEIDQTASYADTISLLGPYTKATAQAIRAIDPSAVIVGASLAGNDSTKLQKAVSYITASDGAGGTSATWLDGISTHYYNQVAAQISQNENPINYANAFKNFQGAMADAGCNLPIYITETGVISADAQGWRAYQRRLLTFAALGARNCLCYQYDNAGYPMSSYVTQFNDVANKLKAGAVISSCVLGMAQMQITIDGVTYTY